MIGKFFSLYILKDILKVELKVLSYKSISVFQYIYIQFDRNITSYRFVIHISTYKEFRQKIIAFRQKFDFQGGVGGSAYPFPK